MRRLILLVAVAACGDDGATTPPDAAGTLDLAAVPQGCVPERALADRADDTTLDQIHVLYVTSQDGADRQRDTNGQICNSMRAVATWFHGQSDAYLRFDTQDRLIDIGFVRLPETDAQMRGTDPANTDIDTGTGFVRERIERELVAMGMIESNKLYAVFYEGSSVYACGGGAYPPLIVARVGAMYLQGMPPGVTQPCSDVLPWGQASLVPSYIDYGILHELVHSMGIVPMGAPNEHAAGHVYDVSSTTPARDLMYSPRTSSDPAWAVTDPNGLLIDINRDDYFTTGSVDLAKMSLLSPLPADAKRPYGW
ncbi:MAG TPA: hypothetical protein VLB44_00120 [Kofleriaceae bacterium]|nr:hypothetical protein [Kofleriaceae bacterium]